MRFPRPHPAPAIVALLLLVLSGSATSAPCVVPDNGAGTIDLPPAGCDYLSPGTPYVIIDGLPPGTTIEMAPVHKDFVCGPGPACTLAIPVAQCEAPGGSLGGDGHCSELVAELQVTGTGALAGFNRVLVVPLEWEVHTAPRIPGDPVQDFDTEIVRMQGSLFGDPDFDQLSLRVGSSFGLSSSGHTTLTDLGNGTFDVESFFDVAYEIDFVGAPGSVLDGFNGTTTSAADALRMQTGANPCEVPDNGTGTATLPPAGCEYLGEQGGAYEIVSGLPAGTTIELAPIHRGYLCPASTVCSAPLAPGSCETAGGGLGGNLHCSDLEVELAVTGTGALAGFSRTLIVPLEWEFHSAPRTPGDPVQDFDTELVLMQGQLFGDPDFDTLELRAGGSFGLPSPGRTRLTRLGPPGSDFEVESFFDVQYEITFLGAPGSLLEGLGGTSPGTLRIATGDPDFGPPNPVPVPTGAWVWLSGALLAAIGLRPLWRLRGATR